MTWPNKYIGIPWEAGSTDCWHFAVKVWKEQFNWKVSIIDVDPNSRLQSARAFIGHREREKWKSVSAPREGDAVLMGKSKVPCHVGIWCETNGGGILHSLEHNGVIFSKLSSLEPMGLRVLGYYTRIEK